MSQDHSTDKPGYFFEESDVANLTIAVVTVDSSAGQYFCFTKYSITSSGVDPPAYTVTATFETADPSLLQIVAVNTTALSTSPLV